MGVSRFRVSDRLWAQFRTAIPPRVNTHRFGGGRPRADDRACLDGIFFVLRTGCQWNALRETDLCPSSTANDRFREWVRDGTFERFFHGGVEAYDELVGIDWRFLSMDGAMTKAPLGGKINGPQSHRPRQKWRQTQPAGRGHGRTSGRGRRWSQHP
jgi:putative transposase